MSLISLSMTAVMLLLDPSEVVDAEAAAAISEDADRVHQMAADAKKSGKTAVITGQTSDFDRQAGVVMFEGGVQVVYDTDYTLCADRVFAFMSGSNQLGRVVAVGHVAITNDTRVCTAPMATYRRNRSEIELFGDRQGTLARLVENGDDRSALEGTRIRFWLDSERVEIEGSSIQVEQQKGNGGAL